MPAHPYSARFMSGRGSSLTETYTVPAGKRAVVRYVCFLHWVQCTTILFVHGIPLAYYQGADGVLYREVRHVLYAGETVSVVVSGPDVSYSVDGFVFADDGGRPDDADNVISLRAGERPTPAGQLLEFT